MLRSLQYRLLVSAGPLAIVLSLPLACLAQEEPRPGASNYLSPGEPEPSKDEWRQRIEEARRRARDIARERRLHPEAYVPIPEDADVIASRRVLRDETLRRGDIVRTKKGMFVFQGDSDRPRDEQDFVPVVPK